MALPTPAPAIAGLQPYKVPRHGAPLDLLLDGIGGLVPPDDFFRRLDDADPERLVRQYPDTSPLAARLAARHGIDPSQVIVTSGGDDALDRACRALLTPQRSIVLPSPTFEMIARYASWAGGEIRTVDWPGDAYPLQAVIDAVDATTTAIAVVSPNNPTGAVITEAQLRELSAAAPHAVLLVDLAYVEFADVDLSPVVLSLPNAVGFRTLSKAYGLAGLRVGYAFGPAEVIGWMRASGNPYTVSGPSVHLACRRLDEAGDEVPAFIQRVRDQRDDLGDLLASLGTTPQRSQANYVFTRSPKALWVRDALAGLGIGVRVWPDHPELGDAIRINVPGSDAILARLAHALRTALAPEAMILDMDGVIADVSSSYREAIIQTAAAFGATVTKAHIRAAKDAGGANNDWIVTQRLIHQIAGTEVPLPEVTATFERIYHGHGTTPGLKRTERLLIDRAGLLALKASGPLAIVTGRPRTDAVEFLELHGIDDLFDVLVCMEDAPAKPDPAPVLAALKALGVTRAWMVGDTPDDVRAARAAGVIPLGVVAPGDVPAHAHEVLTAAGAARVLPDVNTLQELLS